MSGDRLGRAVRALRHRHSWTQAELGSRVGCSASVISRVERGSRHACSLQTLERITEALGARLVMFVDWRGWELERLLDADHASLQERWAERKAAAGGGRWASRQEVTYNVYGDRGSIDDLAFDVATGTLLVSELKTGIYDEQRTLMKMDEKERLAARCAERFGWSIGGSSAASSSRTRARIVAASRTTRRSLAASAAVAVRRLPGSPIRAPTLMACWYSFRCQICVGRTVGEQDANACATPRLTCAMPSVSNGRLRPTAPCNVRRGSNLATASAEVAAAFA